MDKERIDTAAEPVDHQDESEFMDTGVLHERPKSKKADDEEGSDGRVD